MPTISIMYGIALIGYGIYLYFEKNPEKSPTALIPAFFGAAFLLLGLLASFKESFRKHAMHAAAIVGLFGFLGGLGMGLPKLEIISGQPPKRPEAVTAQIMLGVLCGIYTLQCVKSFIDARKARKQAAQAQPSA